MHMHPVTTYSALVPSMVSGYQTNIDYSQQICYHPDRKIIPAPFSFHTAREVICFENQTNAANHRGLPMQVNQ